MADTLSQQMINAINAVSTRLAAAEETVVNAVAEIQDAQGVVNNAVQTATEAKNTADTAKTNATNAVNTANTANNNASNAVNTANTANNNATNAVNTANAAVSRVADVESKLDGYENSIAPLYGNVMEAMSLAGAAARDIETQRFVRNQIIDATIVNRGVVDGLIISKSVTATRNISVTDGVVFMDGREYPVVHQENTAHIPNNTTASTGYSIIYAILEKGVIEVESTPLNAAIPDEGIELYRVTIPAGNTENNDPYLSNVSLTDTSRREPGWPSVQLLAGQVYVPLNHNLPDADYMVHIEVTSATSFHQLGSIAATQKKTNGFLLVSTGTADKIVCRCHVKHVSLLG